MQDSRERSAPVMLGMRPERVRWLFVALGLIINLWLGTVYAWSVFVSPLTEYFTTTLGQDVTVNEVLLPFSVFLAMLAITMLLTGRYVDTLMPRNVTILGGILTGVGWLAASVATSIVTLSIAYGVIGGFGVGIAYGATIAVAARWFPDRRGFAVGLTVAGVGFSALITANLAGYLLSAYGIVGTFRTFGFLIILLTVPLALPLSFPPAGWKPVGWDPSVTKRGHGTCECSRAEMVQTPTFRALWICYFLACMAGLMAISVSQPVGTDLLHIETSLATALVGFFALFNGGGRPLFGSLTDHLNPRSIAMISFVLIALASLMMWQWPIVPVYIASFAIFWGCLGGWLAIAPTATASYFGTADYPRCYGVVFLAYGAGAIAGPQLAGFIRTTTGTYLGIFPYSLAVAILGIIIASLFLHPPEPGSVHCRRFRK